MLLRMPFQSSIGFLPQFPLTNCSPTVFFTYASTAPTSFLFKMPFSLQAFPIISLNMFSFFFFFSLPMTKLPFSSSGSAITLSTASTNYKKKLNPLNTVIIARILFPMNFIKEQTIILVSLEVCQNKKLTQQIISSSLFFIKKNEV